MAVAAYRIASETRLSSIGSQPAVFFLLFSLPAEKEESGMTWRLCCYLSGVVAVGNPSLGLFEASPNLLFIQAEVTVVSTYIQKRRGSFGGRREIWYSRRKCMERKKPVPSIGRNLLPYSLTCCHLYAIIMEGRVAA